jgi:hypothetical protein
MVRRICRRQRRDPVGADTQNRLQAFLSVIPLDLFALLRSRSTGGQFLNGIRSLSL